MFDANEVINGLYGFVYDENGKQMQETKEEQRAAKARQKKR